MTIRGPLQRADLPSLFERTSELLRAGSAEVLLCHVEGLAADLIAAEALARLALLARRGGCRTQLRGASPELHALVGLMGLAEVLGAAEVPGPAKTPGRTGDSD